MFIVKKLYRENYTGEDVVVTRTYYNQDWHDEKEWVPNMVTNVHLSGQAAVIGNGITRKEFDLKLLSQHKGGLEGANKLQTYGCNALYREFVPDFLVVTGAEITAEIAASGYCADHIVYSTAAHMMEYPGKFYLIPQNLSFNAGTLAIYLAAFDGHKKVFMIGFDGQDTEKYNYNLYAGTAGYQTTRNAQTSEDFWNKAMRRIFNVYNDTEFIRVMPTEYARFPGPWLDCPNVRQIDYNQFKYEADLG